MRGPQGPVDHRDPLDLVDLRVDARVALGVAAMSIPRYWPSS